MLLSVVRKIPFIQSLASFSWESHRDASKKFVVLWVLSILPVIFASIAMLTGDEDNVLASILSNITSGFFATDQFIYAVSFLSPMLYLLYEKYQAQREYIDAQRRSPESLGKKHEGFGLIIVITLVLLLFTAFAYGLKKGGSVPESANDIFSGGAKIVYGYAMFCWYFTIVESISRDQVSGYMSTNRRREKGLEKEFAMRIQKRTNP